VRARAGGGVSPRLAERQRDFASWLLAREAPAQTPGLIGDARASAAERLHVYRYAYLSRGIGVMREDFPALLAAVGRERFEPLAAAYLRAHPSRHFSLRQLGARFPAWLAESEQLPARELRASAPWGAQLARLELALTEAFDAADARPLARSDLEQLPPAEWEALALALTPGAQLLSLAWPVRALRAAHDAQQPLPLSALTPQPEHLLVWRRDERVLQRACGADEHALLARVAAGVRFGELCGLAAALRGDEDAAAFVASLLARWVEDGVLRAEARAASSPAPQALAAGATISSSNSTLGGMVRNPNRSASVTTP
jgi:hypothetical protein